MVDASFRHLCSINDTPTSHIQSILAQAQSYVDNQHHRFRHLNSLKNSTVVNAFFENSTRTRISFELAAQRLSATVINLPVAQSAIQKGESLKDTLENCLAMGCQFFVIRHSDDHILERLRHDLNGPCCLINAGTGCSAHPSQALGDLLTISQHKPNLTDLSIAIIGDIKHSRVVSSQLALYQKLGIKDIRLIAPKPWQLESVASHIQVTTDIQAGIADCDVVNTLRIQAERMLGDDEMDLAWYRQHYQLTATHMAQAKPDAIILHPGPINRDIEIASHCVDGPQARILQQVSNGVAVRMAIFNELLTHNRERFA